MSYSTEKLAGEPIILHTMHADYKGTRDAEPGAASIIALLDAEIDPVYLILDVVEAKFGIDDLVHAANVGARGKNPMMRHPNMREAVVVTRSDLLRLAARGLDSDVFGHVRFKIVGTLDEVLAYCRGQSAG